MNGITVVEPRPVQEVTWPDGDRRRPGRVVYDTPELVKLLRRTASVELGSAEDFPRAGGELGCNNAIEGDGDGLRAARGILMAVILSLGCWVTIGAAVWLF